MEQTGKQFYTATGLAKKLRENGISASGSSIAKLIRADEITASRTAAGRWQIGSDELERLIFTAQYLGNFRVSNGILRA